MDTKKQKEKLLNVKRIVNEQRGALLRIAEDLEDEVNKKAPNEAEHYLGFYREIKNQEHKLFQSVTALELIIDRLW